MSDPTPLDIAGKYEAGQVWLAAHPQGDTITLEQIVARGGTPAHWAFTRSPSIVCADGLTISVQAHEGAYCSPRWALTYRDEDYVPGPYTEVEVWVREHTSEQLDMLPPAWAARVAEDGAGEDYAGGVIYGYVPVEWIADLIDMHGGQIGNLKAYHKGNELVEELVKL